MMSPRLPRLLLVGTFCLAAASPSGLLAHHGVNCGPIPMPPQPPPPGRTLDMQEVFPLRWSWVHWWEANRMRFLETARQGPGPQMAQPAQVAELRARALAALREAVTLPHEELREYAALAMGELVADAAKEEPPAPAALDGESETDATTEDQSSPAAVLRRLVEEDPSDHVRQAAVIAQGLIGDAAVAADLTKQTYADGDLRNVGILALSLAEVTPAEPWAQILDAIRAADPARATTAAFALRQHPEMSGLERLERTIRRHDSAWVVSEAILALGAFDDPRGLDTLALVATTHPQDMNDSPLRRYAAWESLYEKMQETARIRQEVLAEKAREQARGTDPYEEYLKQHEEFYKNDPNPPDPEAKRGPVRVRLTVGRERIYMERLRASAAIALGQMGVEQAERPLLALLDEREDEFNHLPKGFAIMALGQRGSRAALPKLLAIASHESERGRLKSSEQRASPTRGLAALALGLYAQPHETPQGVTDRPGYDRALELLGARLLDDREEVEVRSAAAVALGLTGRAEVLPVLVRAARSVSEREEALHGYLLLARGMLGDLNILEPAAVFLHPDNDRTDMQGILGRRAAVLGLGLLRSNEAVPILLHAWESNYYVNRETILALDLCDVYSAAEEVVEELAESDDLDERAFMAEAVGPLLGAEDDEISKLQAFVAHSNYTMRNERLMPFGRLGNVFLFDYLIPAFGMANWQ